MDTFEEFKNSLKIMLKKKNFIKRLLITFKFI